MYRNLNEVNFTNLYEAYSQKLNIILHYIYKGKVYVLPPNRFQITMRNNVGRFVKKIPSYEQN